LIPKIWQSRLDEAATDDEVLDVAREYVARFTFEDLARLPDHCRPGPLDTREEISRYARVLLSHHCAGDAATERMVTRLASFFSAAALRLSALTA
jgi:hypothetical protein